MVVGSHPIDVHVAPRWLVTWLLVIPHVIVLVFLWVGAVVVFEEHQGPTSTAPFSGTGTSTCRTTSGKTRSSSARIRPVTSSTQSRPTRARSGSDLRPDPSGAGAGRMDPMRSTRLHGPTRA